MGIRARALLLFLLLGALPLGLSIGLLLPSYGQAVRESEDQLQLATVAELAGTLERRWSGVREDADAVAAAVAHAALMDDPKAAEALVQSALAARPRVDVARLEIPSAKVDTVLAKEGAATDGTPHSTPEQREETLRAPVVFAPIDATRGSLVVAVPKLQDQGAQGWITVPLYLRPLSDAAQQALAVRDFGSTARLLVVDRKRRVVAAVGEGLPAVGQTSANLPIWSSLPQSEGKAGLAIKNEFAADGEEMVGAVHVLPEQGWTVAIWRPQSVAMAGYGDARRTAFFIAAGALIVALILGLLASRAVTRPVLDLAERARQIGQRRWAELSPPQTRSDELGSLDVAMHKMAKDLQAGEVELEREIKLRSDLSRFVSQEVVEGIVEGDLSLELGGERRAVTVLFADMVAFTAAAESEAPEKVVAMLNELFSVLTEVVFRHGGTVDKFIGDCIMAIWGAPVADGEHALKALEAAEDMMRFLEAGRGRWRDEYGVEMRLAIGINSGEAIVGNVGSRERMEYTVIGDVVNVAARLETIAAPDQVLLTAATLAEAGEDFEVRRLGERSLTGRSEGVEIYEMVTL